MTLTLSFPARDGTLPLQPT
uniref:Uncharacterized protein n=1 Tax=Rhizophora mucronata TaxID=61149 RepID=A0A2P2QU57_RHIMU